MTPSSAAPGIRPAGIKPAGIKPAATNPPRWSRFIPWMFVGGFAIIIAVNGALIYFAQSSFSGLETEQAYERGLHYNRALEAAAAQERLGWHGAITLSDRGNGPRELTVLFADKEAKPIDGLKVEAFLLRPSNEGLDLTVPLAGQGDGRYVANIELPAPGLWDVRIVARDGDLSWQQSERLFAK